jgi:hypothetical protein
MARRSVDRISLRAGKTYEVEVYWDRRRLAHLVANAVQLAKA